MATQQGYTGNIADILPRVTRFSVFLLFLAVQMVGFLLLEAGGVVRFSGFGLQIDDTVYSPGRWMSVAAAFVALDVLNAYVLIALFRRAERAAAAAADDDWPENRAA